MITVRPQAHFDDLYTAVYRLIDDAKSHHNVIKLYKGSHASPDPHPVVLDYGTFFAAHRRGVLGYACHSANPRTDRYRVYDLDEFDRHATPRVSTRRAFTLLARTGRRPDEAPDAYLSYVANRHHHLGAYRGGSSGYDDESRAFAAAYFQQLGLAVQPSEVSIFCGGFKGALICTCAAVMSLRQHDALRHTGGLVLAPAGYYQSLRLIPAIFGGVIEVATELDGEAITGWLANTRHRIGRIIYVPLVNNADGRVLSRARACSIAHAVLDHNRRYPDNPVWVVADDVYAGSHLYADITPQPIAALCGSDLGDDHLGAMSDHTVTIMTPSKTVALATSRVAFATTTRAAMRVALAHYRTVFSFGRVPQAGELSGIAALCLTPQSWVDGWNAEYLRRLAALTTALDTVNHELGGEVYQISRPEGGWYFALRVARHLFPADVTTAVHAGAVLLHYGQGRQDSGVAMLPGELFGLNLGPPSPWLTLRGSLAVSCDDLRSCIKRLRDFALVLRGPRAPWAVRHALARAHVVADLDRIVAQRRY